MLGDSGLESNFSFNMIILVVLIRTPFSILLSTHALLKFFRHIFAIIIYYFQVIIYMMYITLFIATSCFQELLISLITFDIYPLIMHPFQNSNFCGFNIWGHITTVPTCRKSQWLLVQCYHTELPNTKITYFPVTLNRHFEEKWDQNSPFVYAKEIMSL